MPNLYIISGCNGAGKTTASYSVLPDILDCKEFVNADEIAKGLSPFQPEKVAIEAGRIMLERINSLIKQNVDFAFETTLAAKSYARLVKLAKSQGYFVTLIYFWLNSPELAVERVRNRVNSGGHDIPISVIYRRYESGMNNLGNIYLPICDFWLIIDNSEPPFQIVAEGNYSGIIEINDPDKYNQIIRK